MYIRTYIEWCKFTTFSWTVQIFYRNVGEKGSFLQTLTIVNVLGLFCGNVGKISRFFNKSHHLIKILRACRRTRSISIFMCKSLSFYAFLTKYSALSLFWAKACFLSCERMTFETWAKCLLKSCTTFTWKLYNFRTKVVQLFKTSSERSKFLDRSFCLAKNLACSIFCRGCRKILPFPSSRTFILSLWREPPPPKQRFVVW